MSESVNAPVVEIFSSLQGEGLHLGERQIFIRFAGCPWRCVYCDTPGALEDVGRPRQTVGNVLARVDDLQKQHRHSGVSLTGGEPVLRADFLSVLIPELKSRGLAVHLETSATHPSLFRKIAGFCDVVAADVKLPSAIGRDCWEEHRAFLEMAGDRAFVKVVLTSATTDGEMARVVELLAGLNPVPPLILQPVTALPPLESRRAGTPGAAAQFVRPPTADRVGDFFKTTRARLPRVVVIPQMHPVWGVP